VPAPLTLPSTTSLVPGQQISIDYYSVVPVGSQVKETNSENREAWGKRRTKDRRRK
jgi:hypothetical protein